MLSELTETLTDIRTKLAQGIYLNEEHVRIGVVIRLLHTLGWDVWDPGETYLEFPVVPAENGPRADIALFVSSRTPCTYIEVKSVGRLSGDITAYESELRDYNRNNIALFSVMTDGQKWRFYYSHTGGDFSSKCFKTLDLATDDPQDIESTLVELLSRDVIADGSARTRAEYYLQVARKQRAMERQLPHARRAVLEPPFPTLPEALVRLVATEGVTVSSEEASAFIREYSDKSPPYVPPPMLPTGRARPTPSRAEIPVSLAEILEVCHEVLRGGRSYTEAIKVVTARRGLRSQHTVEDACTRQIGLNTAQFRSLLNNPKELAHHLSQRFPQHAERIRASLL